MPDLQNIIGDEGDILRRGPGGALDAITPSELAASAPFIGAFAGLDTIDGEPAIELGDDLVLVRRDGAAAQRMAVTGRAGSNTNPFIEVNPVPGAVTGDPTIAGFQVYRVGNGAVADREFFHIEARGAGYEDYVLGSFKSGTGQDRPIRFTMTGGVEAFHIKTDATIQLSKQMYGLTALYLDGTAGNYVTVPNHADIAITGDIDLRAKVAANDYTPAADMAVISRYLPSGDQRSYLLLIETTGYVRLLWTTDGTSGTLRNVVSSSPLGVSDGTPTWVRATLDVDNGAGGHTVNFYKSTDGVTWTALGAAVTTAGTTSIHAGTAPLRVGARGDDGVPFIGKIHRASVRNGIDGTLAAQLICDGGAVDPRYRDNTGKVWTFTGSAWSWMSHSG